MAKISLKIILIIMIWILKIKPWNKIILNIIILNNNKDEYKKYFNLNLDYEQYLYI